MLPEVWGGSCEETCLGGLSGKLKELDGHKCFVSNRLVGACRTISAQQGHC